MLMQQACPAPPQVPQLPFAHMPPTAGQVEPGPVQVWFTQQPLSLQALPAQHG
jgi:hypothetical protein